MEKSFCLKSFIWHHFVPDKQYHKVLFQLATSSHISPTVSINNNQLLDPPRQQEKLLQPQPTLAIASEQFPDGKILAKNRTKTFVITVAQQ